MWTDENRAAYARKSQRNPIDLADAKLRLQDADDKLARAENPRYEMKLFSRIGRRS